MLPLLLAGLFAVSACGGGPDPEAPAPTYGVIPELRGTRVLVFPVQGVQDESRRAALDAEIRFAVQEAGLDWLLPPDLEALQRRSPNLNLQITNLPVGAFGQREVLRVGDPIFGILRRLNGVTDAAAALLPVSAAVEAEGVGGERWTLSAALVDARRGFVLWYGTVSGEVGEAGSPLPVATAAMGLVRRLVPPVE